MYSPALTKAGLFCNAPRPKVFGGSIGLCARVAAFFEVSWTDIGDWKLGRKLAEQQRNGDREVEIGEGEGGSVDAQAKRSGFS